MHGDLGAPAESDRGNGSEENSGCALPTRRPRRNRSWGGSSYAAFIVADIGVFLVQLHRPLERDRLRHYPVCRLGAHGLVHRKNLWLGDGVRRELTFLYALAGIELTVFEYFAMPAVLDAEGPVSIIAGDGSWWR